MDATVKVPDALISDIVRAQIVATLSNSPNILNNTINAMLQAKANSYSNKTMLQEMTEAMIRELASVVLREYLAEKREEIRAAVMKRLRDENTFADRMADSMVNAVGTSLYVEVRMKVEERD